MYNINKDNNSILLLLSNLNKKKIIKNRANPPRLVKKIRQYLRTYIKYISNNKIKKSTNVLKYIGLTTVQFKIYIESKFKPGMTWDNYGYGLGFWQIDHIKRVSNFDLTKKDDLLKVNYYTNLQPIWHEEHLKKTIKEKNNKNENI